MGFPRLVNGNETESYRTQSTENTPSVGTKMVIEDGRTFRWAENGGVAAVNARVFMSIAPAGGHLDEAVGTIAAGETIITGVVATALNPAADLFKNGYLFVTAITQLDPVHRIKSNTLFASNTGTITLYNPLLTAIASTDTVTYVENPFRDIVVGLASAYTAPPVGVIVRAIALDEYGWIATGGPTRVLTEDALIVGAGVSISTTNDAGAVVAWVPETATTVNNMPIGSCMALQADTEKSIIFLRLEN
jgi:hypothetical protein